MKKSDVFLDLGHIVEKDYFIRFTIGSKEFEFVWKESKIFELLEFLNGISSNGEPDEVGNREAEYELFSFLHNINPKFKLKHYNELDAKSRTAILQVILKPIFKKTTGHSEKKKPKKPLKPLVLS